MACMHAVVVCNACGAWYWWQVVLPRVRWCRGDVPGCAQPLVVPWGCWHAPNMRAVSVLSRVCMTAFFHANHVHAWVGHAGTLLAMWILS